MRATARLLLLGLILALTVPAPVLAQSAGDDQYVDPFQNDGTEDNQGSGNSGSQGGSETTTTPDTSTEGGDGTASAGVESAGGDGTALPRTGLMVGGVAIAGVTLLLGGAALRRRA